MTTAIARAEAQGAPTGRQADPSPAPLRPRPAEIRCKDKRRWAVTMKNGHEVWKLRTVADDLGAVKVLNWARLAAPLPPDLRRSGRPPDSLEADSLASGLRPPVLSARAVATVQLYFAECAKGW